MDRIQSFWGGEHGGGELVVPWWHAAWHAASLPAVHAIGTYAISIHLPQLEPAVISGSPDRPLLDTGAVARGQGLQ